MSDSGPRKVLYLTPSVRLLGARRSLLALIENLDRDRWEPVVCGQRKGHLSDVLEQTGVPFHTIKTGWWRKGKHFLWRPFAIAQLRSLIREHEIDLVHCNEIYPNPFAVRAADQAGLRRGRRIPVITHMRLSITERMIKNYDLRRADMIIVPSEGAGRDFDLWEDKEDRVRVVYNGVDLTEFSRLRTAAEARRHIGVPPEGMLFAAIGQVGPRKAGDVILKAMERLAAGYPDARLMFVGNPHRGQEDFHYELTRAAELSGLAGRVHFFPFTRQILPYYEAADVNLLVSRDEGFGRTIIEAAAFGVPSIGSRVGGIPELIQDGATGLLVEKENEVQLANAMNRYLSDPAFVKSTGEAAFRHTAQHFSIRSHVEAITEIYDRMMYVTGG